MTTKLETAKLTVWAKATPGAKVTVVGSCDTMQEARAIASRFDDRRDLCNHDVFIRAGIDGKIIERCGPAR